MKFLIIILSVCLFSLIGAEYTKLNWSLCGAGQVKVYNIDLFPMPILQPGINLLFCIYNCLYDNIWII